MTLPKICIVTPNYICGSPRAVKEADALHNAGYDVRVVFSQGNLHVLRNHDKELLKEKPWRYSIIGWSSSVVHERRLYHLSRIRHAIARFLPMSFGRLSPLAELGAGRMYPELSRLVALEPADLFIGHYPDGLAAAGWGARKWNARLAYDFEDFHVGEGISRKNQKRTEILERRYLKMCSYTSAASEVMTTAITEFYGIEPPITIHNAFPFSERQSLDEMARDRQGASMSVYWYSQTIGLDRGIQDAIRAAGLMNHPVQIHLRGALSPNVRDALCKLASECGVVNQLYFHGRVPPSELLSRAVEHDIGLAAEQPVDRSRQISVTNKLFLYLLAGLCIAATDVPGQRRIIEQSPEAGFLYPAGDHEALAQLLTHLVEEPNLLKRKKAASLKAAKERWNWESESRNLVTAVANALSRTTVGNVK